MRTTIASSRMLAKSPRAGIGGIVGVAVLLLVSATPTHAASARADDAAEAAAGANPLVVDDDKAQCAMAGFASIQAAVDAASAGDVVRVCPGLYTEAVVVDEAIELRGQPEAVESVDCLAPILPELDPTVHAILEAPVGTGLPPQVTLHGGGVELHGFVIQRPPGALPEATFGAAPQGQVGSAVVTDDSSIGSRIHHNVFRRNPSGIGLRGGSVEAPARADHNCIRAQRWGIANEWARLSDARIDHNTTYRNWDYTFEMTGGASGVVLDHNLSVGDASAFMAESSAGVQIDSNEIRVAGQVRNPPAPQIGHAMRIFGGNQGLRVVENMISDSKIVGIALAAFRNAQPLTPQSNVGVVLARNTITGTLLSPGSGTAIGVAVNGAVDSTFSENVLSHNQADGLVLRVGNTRNHVWGNHVYSNTRYGIWADGAADNTLESNHMLGNGTFDARDQSVVAADGSIRTRNVWRSNVCVTDDPPGAICGTTDAGPLE